jgi:hypothetical protein
MKILPLFLFISLFSLKSYCQSKEIIGVWTVFSDDAPVTSMDCDGCATWEFKADHTAIFTNPDGGQDTMTWSIDENNKLTFQPAEAQKELAKRFAALKFDLVFTKADKYTELRMSVPGQRSHPVLRKI